MLLFPHIISQFSSSKWEAESMQEALLLSFHVYPSSLHCFFFSFTNLSQHGADSCPVPALPARMKLLLSAFCQQSCLYEHYRSHHTNISGINAELALTQNCAQQLGPGTAQDIHLGLERCIFQQKWDKQFRATASSPQTAPAQCLPMLSI